VSANLLAHEALVEVSALLGAELLFHARQALLANLMLDGDPIELPTTGGGVRCASLLALTVRGQVTG